MSSIIDGIEQRTNLADRNRVELLLFRLGGRQVFGINVFKVREVIRCPALTRMPHSHPVVRGVATMRGRTISILDLGLAIGVSRSPQELENGFVVVAEFSRRILGFLVSGVDRIINVDWEQMLPAPKGAGAQNYLTAVIRAEEDLIEIIDVEKVLAEVTGAEDMVSAELIEKSAATEDNGYKVFVIDDSNVARKQITRALDAINVGSEVAKDGREALEKLKAWSNDGGPPLAERFVMVISDVEMPEMDGCTLTRNIKDDPEMRDLFVLLHTSHGGVFNRAKLAKVGADELLAKFNANDLGSQVLKRIAAREAEPRAA